jgi:hypothetical protein
MTYIDENQMRCVISGAKNQAHALQQGIRW